LGAPTYFVRDAIGPTTQNHTSNWKTGCGHSEMANGCRGGGNMVLTPVRRPRKRFRDRKGAPGTCREARLLRGSIPAYGRLRSAPSRENRRGCRPGDSARRQSDFLPNAQVCIPHRRQALVRAATYTRGSARPDARLESNPIGPAGKSAPVEASTRQKCLVSDRGLRSHPGQPAHRLGDHPPYIPRFPVPAKETARRSVTVPVQSKAARPGSGRAASFAGRKTRRPLNGRVT
jgi:hypothetical protein